MDTMPVTPRAESCRRKDDTTCAMPTSAAAARSSADEDRAEGRLGPRGAAHYVTHYVPSTHFFFMLPNNPRWNEARDGTV